MNILLINHYAGSPDMGMEFRPYYFAREWIKSGHRVDIIAADYSHLRRVNPDVKHDFQEQVIDGIHYYWLKTGRYDQNGVKRAITMAQFIGKLWIHTKKIIKEMDPDVVICSSTYPLDTYVGQRIRRKSKKKVKLVHEVHDMWPISPIEIGGMSPRHPFIRVMQMAENSFCRKSDVIVSLLPAAKKYFIRHGMNPDKFVHIPNGIVLEEWIDNENKIPQQMADYFTKNKAAGKFNLCFFGSLQKTYNLELLIKTVIRMDVADKLAVTFVGPGHDKEELMQMCRGHEDIFMFFEPINKNAIPDLFHYIDASFVGAQSQKIFRFGICMNKLFDAMMGGKPILYMVDAPNNYVKEYKCGVSVEGKNSTALQKGIEKLLSLNEEEKKQMGKNGIHAIEQYYNYLYLAQKFVQILQ